MNNEPSSYLITPTLAQSIDKWTINIVGIPSFTLMELAGSKAASQFNQDFPDAKKLLFLIGKGNNAGDGLVMARHLLLTNSEIEISLVFVFNEPPSTADGAKNWSLLNGASLNSFQDRLHLISVDQLLNGTTTLSNFDFCVDAIFGVGLSRPIEEPISRLINHVNKSCLHCASLDVPSGLSAENGLILGAAITAKCTYTFGFNKIGFHLNDAYKTTGDITTLGLAYDIEAFQTSESFTKTEIIASPIGVNVPVLVQSTQAIPKHKYDGGAVLIIGSSEGLTGATISVAQAAWAAGASAVFLILPKGIAPIFESTLPYAIKWLVGNDSDTYLSERHLDEIVGYLSKYDKKGSVCFGPGVGQHSSTLVLANKLMPRINQPLVLDADSLKALDVNTTFGHKKTPTILTPHLGEWATIQKNYFTPISSKEQITLGSINELHKFALDHNISVIRKGSPTIYCSSSGKVYLTSEPQTQVLFNKTGFGDVLSGLLATALVRFNTDEEAIIWSLQKGLKAAHWAVSHKKKFYPETIIDYVKTEE